MRLTPDPNTRTEGFDGSILSVSLAPAYPVVTECVWKGV
jgi:hypothetical protein